MGKEKFVGIVFVEKGLAYFHLAMLGQVEGFVEKRKKDRCTIQETVPLEERGAVHAFLKRAAESCGVNQQAIAC
jgi:hypothetical protein